MNSDEKLDRAIAALRDSETGGPTGQLNADTLVALRRAESEQRVGTGLWGAIRGAGAGVRLAAAAVVIVACGVAVYLAVSRSRSEDPSPIMAATRPTLTPLPQPPAPPVRPDNSDRTLVENVPARQPSSPPAPVIAAPLWSIAGVVTFAGEVPPRSRVDMSSVPECARHHPGGVPDESLVVHNGRLANVVVSVRPANGQELGDTPPVQPALLDQKECRYQPHVLAMRVGQPIVVSNSDPLLHNVHALSLENPPFNFGQPTIDRGRNLGAMKAAEVFKVKCDFHPWMLAYVHVFEHPYYAVTQEDGRFAIPPGLPDGRYMLVAWHERLGEQLMAVNVRREKAGRADFVFRAP